MAGPGPAGVLLAIGEVGTKPSTLSCPFLLTGGLWSKSHVFKTSSCVCGGLSGPITLLQELHSDAQPGPAPGVHLDSGSTN